MSEAILRASSKFSTPPLDPGTHGTPRAFMVSLAVILSPITLICSAVGPMNFSPWSSIACTKLAFSERNP